MLTIRDLKKAAKEAGCEVDRQDIGDWTICQVMTPVGKCFDDHLHMLRVEWQYHDKDWQHNAIADALERLEAYTPLSSCDNPECDYCVEQN